jgi:hypothetical protein
LGTNQKTKAKLLISLGDPVLHSEENDGTESAWDCRIQPMPVNPAEYVSACAGLGKAEELEVARRPDRRRRPRVQLHWSVRFVRASGMDAVEATTRDLSSDGFFCLSDVPFIPGERLICVIKVPAHDPQKKERAVWIECGIRVMRVGPTDFDGVFGIACRIEDYCFAHSTS